MIATLKHKRKKPLAKGQLRVDRCHSLCLMMMTLLGQNYSNNYGAVIPNL